LRVSKVWDKRPKKIIKIKDQPIGPPALLTCYTTLLHYSCFICNGNAKASLVYHLLSSLPLYSSSFVAPDDLKPCCYLHQFMTGPRQTHHQVNSTDPMSLYPNRQTLLKMLLLMCIKIWTETCKVVGFDEKRHQLNN